MRLTRKTKVTNILLCGILVIMVIIMIAGAGFGIIALFRQHELKKWAIALAFTIMAIGIVLFLLWVLWRSIRVVFGYRWIDLEPDELRVHWKDANVSIFPLPNSLKSFQDLSEREVTIILENGTERFGFSNTDFKEDRNTVSECLNEIFPMTLVSKDGSIKGNALLVGPKPPKGMTKVLFYPHNETTPNQGNSADAEKPPEKGQKLSSPFLSSNI